MFVVMAIVGAVQVPVVEVANVALMLDGDVLAVRSMGVVVIFVDFVSQGRFLQSVRNGCFRWDPRVPVCSARAFPRGNRPAGRTCRDRRVGV